MKIEIFHASKYGNGAKVAEELSVLLGAKGHEVKVHHIDDAKPKELPSADIYIFGSPTRFGGPIGEMKRFLKKAELPSGGKYAVFATHSQVLPNKKTGIMPTQDEINQMRRTIPTLDEILKEKGMVKIAEKIFEVSADEMKGHLLDGWKERSVAFAAQISP
jgi:flavodoxin